MCHVQQLLSQLFYNPEHRHTAPLKGFSCRHLGELPKGRPRRDVRYPSGPMDRHSSNCPSALDYSVVDVEVSSLSNPVAESNSMPMAKNLMPGSSISARPVTKHGTGQSSNARMSATSVLPAFTALTSNDPEMDTNQSIRYRCVAARCSPYPTVGRRQRRCGRR